MRTRSLLSALCAAATIAVAGPIAGAWADESPPTGDLARLQGQWTALFGQQKNIPMVVTIKGTDVTMTMTAPDGQAHESKGRIKIDEDAKPYKTLDWLDFTTREGKPAPANLGIYKLEGGSITICNGGPGNERPAEFRAGEKGSPQLIVLNRKTAAGTPATAPSAAAGDLRGDLARLQGRWSATKVGREKNATLIVTIQGSSVTLAFNRPDGRGSESKGEIKIDEDAKPYKTLDWLDFKNREGKSVPPRLAIYKLEGNTLTICSGGPGRERPTEFRAGEEGRPSLVVLSRE
jgi:uncharacterized protein (TIGR03067 family)